MLILSRKLGQEIVIADVVIVRVTKISGQTVQLSIEAPEEIQVDRREVYDRKAAESMCVGCYAEPCICLPDDCNIDPEGS